MCAYCERILIELERRRGLCDACAERILDRVYRLEAEPVRLHLNPHALRDLLPWR